MKRKRKSYTKAQPTSSPCSCCAYFEKEIRKFITEESQPLKFTAITKLDIPVINPETNETVYFGKLSVNINYCLNCGRKFKTNKVGD